MTRFRFFCEKAAGEPAVRVRVYGSGGPSSGGRLYPDTQSADGNLLGFVDVPFAELACYPAWNYVDLTGVGGLTFEPGEEVGRSTDSKCKQNNRIDNFLEVICSPGVGVRPTKLNL